MSTPIASLIAEANRTENPHVVRSVMETLTHGWGMTYAESRDYFGKQGIDAGRFEELCQIADYAA